MPISLTFLGAAQTVTGSATLVECGPTRFLVDCGTAQGVTQPDLPSDLPNLDAVILTHAHLDHCGQVPALFDNGFVGQVHGHAATGDIATVVWDDTRHLFSRRGDAPFTAQGLRRAKSRLVRHTYREEFTIGEARIRLHDAGHILGSSHVEIEYQGTRVLFSGDIGTIRTPIIRDPTNQWEEPFDAVVIESTYGNRRHKPRPDTVAELKAIVERTIRERGVLLIPAFAIGRTQEILYHFNDMVEAGDIPALPVVVDSPMGDTVTDIYARHEECYDGPTRARLLSGDLPLEFPGMGVARTVAQSRAIQGLRPPFVIVAGSGMCNGGRILGHLKRFLPHASTTVALVGYQGAGTLGRLLAEGADRVTIDDTPVPVNARIAGMGGFSAHADSKALLEWAGKIPGDEIRWFVNHGEGEGARGLSEALVGSGLGVERVVAMGERVV